MTTATATAILNRSTVANLRTVCRNLGIKGASKMNKSAIVAAIIAADSDAIDVTETAIVETTDLDQTTDQTTDLDQITDLDADFYTYALDAIYCDGSKNLDAATELVFLREVYETGIVDVCDDNARGGAFGDYYLSLFVAGKRAMTVPLNVHRSKLDAVKTLYDGTRETAEKCYRAAKSGDRYTRIMLDDGTVFTAKADANGNAIATPLSLMKWVNGPIHDQIAGAIYHYHHCDMPTCNPRGLRYRVKLEKDIEVA